MSYRQFDGVFAQCLTHMTQMGHDEVPGLLEKYEHTISHRSAQFILLCDLRCYYHWYIGQYDEAIRFGCGSFATTSMFMMVRKIDTVDHTWVRRFRRPMRLAQP